MKHRRATELSFFACFSFITLSLWPSVEVGAEADAVAAPSAGKATGAASNDTHTTQAGEAGPDAKFAFTLADLGTGARPDAAGTPRPIVYQYCIPKIPEAFSMVGNTDPTGTIHAQASADSPCGENELSASGHTGQPNYLSVLRAIAKHDFVTKISLVE